MGTPYLGEVKIVSFNFAPKGWALCNGQLLPINQNQPLFSLLGTMYGGDGRVNFALPNLRGRVPIHRTNSYIVGQAGGANAVTLSVAEMPAHTHAPVGSNLDSTKPSAVDVNGQYLWGSNNAAPYSTGTPNVAMNSASMQAVGGGQPHENMQPYLVLNFIVALQGVFPSQT